MRAIILVAALTAGLAGCQTVEESAASAEFVCQQSGLRPGTNAYGRCVNASYAQNRQQAEQAANAVALGAAAGLIGGAVVASSTYNNGYYYGPGYYGGPRNYGGARYYGGYRRY